jgi:hypothetical protein
MLPSGNWYCVVCDAGVVAHDCFGQVICSLVPFQVCVPFYLVEGNKRAHRPERERENVTTCITCAPGPVWVAKF